MSSKTAKNDQIEKFKQAARDLECDDSEKAFDGKLKAIAKPSAAQLTKRGGKPK